MQIFRTEHIARQSSLKINHSTKILTLGSCFADVIGQKLAVNKFNTESNPFGVIYHPIAILNLLSIDDTTFDDKNFLELEGKWYHFLFHSEIFADSKNALIDIINSISDNLKNYIKELNIIVLTFGTAYFYWHIEHNFMASNCHKLASNFFEKRLSDPLTIVQCFEKVFQRVKLINNKVQIIITISPVRHIKDTIELNSVSKSILRYAAHQIATSHNEVIYFPAYEILLDDLRDYRFYKDDLLHPSPFAENYIWEKFMQTFFNDETKKIIEKWNKILSAINHKPFHPDSANHKKFLVETIEKMEDISKFISVETEIQQLKQLVAQ